MFIRFFSPRVQDAEAEKLYLVKYGNIWSLKPPYTK